jgi:hypothetical protein
MKTKNYPNDELAHLWASQAHEGPLYGTNMHFEGSKLYSYGWYLIGWIVSPNVVLIEENTYSMTTASKHYPKMRRAVSHMQTITTMLNVRVGYSRHNTTPELSDIVDIEMARLTALCQPGAFGKKRNIRSFLNQYDQHRENVELLTKVVMGKPLPPEFPEIPNREMWEAKADAFDAGYLDRRKRAEKSYYKLQEQTTEEFLPNFIKKFFAGEHVSNSAWIPGPFGRRRYIHIDIPVLLRIKDGQVNTSLGANVPLEDAQKLWAKIKQKASVHGERAGSFTVTSFNNGLLRIGCHSIPESEIERFTKANPEIFPA